jgi:hypothetical protein
MRIVVFLLLSVTVFLSDGAGAREAHAVFGNTRLQQPAALRDAYGQQSPQTYAPQTYAPQTYAPQTYSPPTHSPQTWSQQSGDAQSRPTPRRRLVKCMISDDADDYCVFYTDRDFRRGSPCSCEGSRGSTN